jgi:hypothetical protein
MKSNRELAIEWWENLNASAKEAYCISYRWEKYGERSENFHSLTGSEIEFIWKSCPDYKAALQPPNDLLPTGTLM